MLAHRIRYHCNYAMGKYKVQSVCVCCGGGCMCVCVGACVHVCVCVCAYMCVRMRVYEDNFVEF